jgi:type II secretory pathway pseudopilin PulG
MKTLQSKIKGVTLLEVLLVLAIASSLLVMMLNYTTQKAAEMRRDKTVLEIQQILNASMSFYLNNSYWPLDGASAANTQCNTGVWSDVPSTLLQPNYLPQSLATSPYQTKYQFTCNSTGTFFVTTATKTEVDAAVIAGRLPMGYRSSTITSGAVPPVACTTTSGSGTSCVNIVASVNIPGQNLNNARSVNFASVYYSGSCVPAPNCPPNMSPDILVMPAAVSGVNEPPACGWGTCVGNVYPVSSFTAYARGDGSGNPVDPVVGPYNCAMSSQVRCLLNQGGAFIPSDGTKYWRVCLNVNTEMGRVDSSSSVNQGKMMGTLVAITRCVPNSGAEVPSGSIDVYQY